ncbi:MAG: methylmalonyl Co-A mutase-associated GTPase MeaB [Planctomycetota bacterium]|nr:methylmalonyl Co-A mutase-associated GTPase MeaB [Planctomycetota bacterium]
MSTLPRAPAELLAAAVLAGDRGALARAISLVESGHPRHARDADALLDALLPHTGRAVRVGVTGVPGAGKSTFIERLGLMLCDEGRRVAVLAIDPSSVVTGGSILGDRTRMARLSAHERAFIRPSPSAGALGGVARRTREASLLCEAAGFDVVLIETVGVGQSESLVADMTDCVLTLSVPGSGDELQGIKRGLLEAVDVIAVNKADGDLAREAARAAGDLAAAMSVLHPDGVRRAAVLTCSARTGEGVADVWRAILDCVDARRAGGELDRRRREQRLRWLRAVIDDRVRALVHDSPAAAAALRLVEPRVRDGSESPGAGAARVIEAFLSDASRPAPTPDARRPALSPAPASTHHEVRA